MRDANIEFEARRARAAAMRDAAERRRGVLSERSVSAIELVATVAFGCVLAAALIVGLVFAVDGLLYRFGIWGR